MARITAVANLKGGVGKTTSAYALGDVLARRGYRVLLIDFDPQASLTLMAGIDPARAEADRRTISVALDEHFRFRGALDLGCFSYPLRDRLALLPTTMALIQTERRLRTESFQELVLHEALASAQVDADVILIDCAPSPSPLLMNALYAAQGVIVPVVPEFLAVQGLGYLFSSIREVQAQAARLRLPAPLRIDGVILTMTEGRTIHSRDMQADVATFLGTQPEAPPILGAVRRSIKMAEAAQEQLPITQYAPTSDQALAYEEIASQLLIAWQLPRPVAALAGGE